MGSKERRERAREEMRENILNAAIELFLEHGIEKTTIRRHQFGRRTANNPSGPDA